MEPGEEAEPVDNCLPDVVGWQMDRMQHQKQDCTAGRR